MKLTNSHRPKTEWNHKQEENTNVNTLNDVVDDDDEEEEKEEKEEEEDTMQ